MPNRLQQQTSPYLLAHAENPVDWYPWGEEAFQRAREEDKPVFLSIGYSACHWCHVMARECFEDERVAALLNRYFISIKVDREERPDIDSVYMAACEAFTGSGGWPTSIFMAAGQEPFFAGTYFPKEEFIALVQRIHEKWERDRPALLSRAQQLISRLKEAEPAAGRAEGRLPDAAILFYRRAYDRENGGFGRAPKFPAPHNLLFLLYYYERRGDTGCLSMAEHTLLQMYRGGLFDHIGGGFCRYSTDERFLIPHFEKMLYDNALLILAYCKAYELTGKPLYRSVAEQTADFVLREMAGEAFYSALDADSGGEEGGYYLFTPQELIRLLGPAQGEAFCRRFGITAAGNFEGKSVPNLLAGGPESGAAPERLPEGLRARLCRYRRERCPLQLDDKVLPAWNGLMIAALCRLYRAGGNDAYLAAARRADGFIRENLLQGDVLYASFRAGRRGEKGFLDDYAACLLAQLSLYGATLDEGYLRRAQRLCSAAFSRFWDEQGGGFYLYGADSEQLFLRPKQTYDGALPSGNSLMAWLLVRLCRLCPQGGYERRARRQLDFLLAQAAQYPPGYAMALLALLESSDPPPEVTAVLADERDVQGLALQIPADAAVRLLRSPAEGFPLKEGKTTFYVCRGRSCLPPVNDLREVF